MALFPAVNFRRIIIPECRREMGSGHIVRSIKLAEFLHADILIPPEHGKLVARGTTPHLVVQHMEIALSHVCVVSQKEEAHTMIIFDKPTLQREDVEDMGEGFYVGIDTAGSARDYLHYLIDTLHQGSSDANVIATNVMPQHRRERWPRHIQKVLVVGGSQEGVFSQVRRLLPSRVVEFAGEGHFIPELAEHLFRYDLVITHYGLSAFEALWARVPVILINPTDHHQKLAKKTPLPSYLWKKGNFPIPHLQTLLDASDALVYSGKQYAPEQKKDIFQVVKELVPRPFPLRKCLNRQEDKSFFDSSAFIEMVRYNNRSSVRYDREYFFTEYRQQYGKTYLEDFQPIYHSGLRRLKEISCITKGKRLLDLGCAYGHFLRAAEHQGYTATGVDISSAAVSYARDTLHLDVWEKDLQELDIEQDLGVELFDVLTMWYILEHIPKPFSFLSRAVCALKKGGVFSFSSPSAEGTSRRLKPGQFFLDNPPDHPVIFLPSMLRESFAPLGLRLVYWKSTGHHPSRLSPFLAKSTVGGSMCRIWSRVLKWGDTFEAYFVKD